MTFSSNEYLQAALGIIILTDLALLGAERRRLCIRLLALQGLVLGLMPLLAHTGPLDLHLAGVAAVFLFVKGVLLPYLLVRTYKRLPPQTPVKPYLGGGICVPAGIGCFLLSVWLGDMVGSAANPLFTVIFPFAFATIFCGLLLIVSNRQALSQIFGYLVLENGIYLLGVPTAQGNALWLELSILLDILMGVFVMGVAVYHISRAFENTNVDSFSSLKD